MADEPVVPEDEAAVPEAEVEATTEADPVADEAADEQVSPPTRRPAMSHIRQGLIIGLVVVIALAGLTGWLGYRGYEAKQNDQLRELLVAVGRQGAINLTSIDSAHAEADVQRILDLATDAFYDDFNKRAQPFIDVVKQVQSKSEGTVTEAGLESMTGEEGKVMAAVTVHTSNRGAPDQPNRLWRMRLTVKKTGTDEAKVSKVEFIP
ncbi:Mce protein [Mycolicibacterium sp. Dal123E01]|uniref:Mce protein n=1 Tax=Mycolicibacterium sp. Dal123E01 TaxID=3457578 RepID=UPI00403EF4B1